jgi:NAD(P)-dependent dehydrogenase (short-subunit alcohol dehydrogenase family)
MQDSLFSVAGKVVVITGAAGLIGRALSAAFAERGATVVGVDVRSSDSTPCLTYDISQADQVSACVAGVLSRHGRVDVLVNSHHYKPAGFTEACAETFPEELWDAILNINLKATFLTCREFGRTMLTQGHGSIINLASTYGIVSSNPDLYDGNSLGNPVAYSASKGGVIMLTKYLGAYWAGRGVRVNCVTPHGVEAGHESEFVRRFSSKSPMRRLMRSDEVAGAVLFLASNASSYATGSNVLVDGGWTAW